MQSELVVSRNGFNTPTSTPDVYPARFCYRLFGLRVGSDFPLPIPAIDPSASEPPAWAFRYPPSDSAMPEPNGTVVCEVRCSEPCHNGAAIYRVQRGPGGAWIWDDRIGTCHVLPGARIVNLYLEPNADERLVAVHLLGQVTIFVMHQLGYPTLHASAVVTDQGAVAFFGAQGRGKSTMAASFLRRGASLLTDDVLRLWVDGSEVYGSPSLPRMKLWQESATCTLGVTEELPDIIATYNKKVLTLGGQFSFADRPARLRRIYLLDRYNPQERGDYAIKIRPLGGQESMAAFLTSISDGAFLNAAESARFLPMYAQYIARAPVAILSYPDGYSYQQQVYERILQELEAE